MAAKKGNNYAEKWTKQVVIDHLAQILHDVQENRIVYLGIALANIDLYSEVWNDWSNKFSADKQVSLAIKKVESKIEANLLSQALSSKVNPAVAIFVLKNKYKWSDKQEVDHTSGGNPIQWVENRTYQDQAGKDAE